MNSAFTPSFSSFSSTTQMTFPAREGPLSRIQGSGHGPQRTAAFLPNTSTGRGLNGTGTRSNDRNSEGREPRFIRGISKRVASAAATYNSASIGRGPSRQQDTQPRDNNHPLSIQKDNWAEAQNQNQHGSSSQGKFNGQRGRRPRANKKGIRTIWEGNFRYREAVMTDAPTLKPTFRDIDALKEAIQELVKSRTPRLEQQMLATHSIDMEIDSPEDIVMVDAPAF